MSLLLGYISYIVSYISIKLVYLLQGAVRILDNSLIILAFRIKNRPRYVGLVPTVPGRCLAVYHDYASRSGRCDLPGAVFFSSWW